MKKLKLLLIVLLILSIIPFVYGNDVLTFDGDDDCVVFPLAPEMHLPFDNYTVSVWFNINGDILNDNDHHIIFETGGAANGLNMYIKDGVLYAGVWSSSHGFPGKWVETPVIANHWYHAALVYQSGTVAGVTLYLDGSNANVADVPNLDYPTIACHPDWAGIGAQIHATNLPDGEREISYKSNFFKGSIDELVLFKLALDSDDIAKLATVNPDDPETPLELITHLRNHAGKIRFPNIIAYYSMSNFYKIWSLSHLFGWLSIEFLDNDLDNINENDDLVTDFLSIDKWCNICYDGKICGNPEKDDQSLPVEFASFEAVVNNGSVKLTWETASETNNAGFNVYRSVNAEEGFHRINPELIKGAISSTTNNKYSFIDTGIEPNVKYSYMIEDVATDGATAKHEPIEAVYKSEKIVVDNFKLHKCYPNPFNPSTNINFSIPQKGKVKIVVYDIKGQLITTLINRNYSEGQYSVKWNGTDSNNNNVSAGVYFYRMETDNGYSYTEKMILTK